jgi:4-diphosphocytidyl-2-C-methyl-D-erythritol kinase
MRSLTVPSYAKLNLYLKILRRRRDGYHDLASVFHRISLRDTLNLKKTPSGFSMTCSNPNLTTGEDNIICRAYRILSKAFPEIGGVSVRLKKNIPLGAGLGGGSSNAAAFLLGMRKLYGLPLSGARLMKMGKELGADVPFFLSGHSLAVARGIGEKLVQKPCRGKKWFVLLVSEKGLATKDVYRNLPKNLPVPSLTKINRTVKLICSFLEEGCKSSLDQWLRNDLERPAFELRPSLQKLLDRFRQLGTVTAVRMSGSGPTLFAILPNRKQALQVARKGNVAFFYGRCRRRPQHRLIVCHSV